MSGLISSKVKNQGNDLQQQAIKSIRQVRANLDAPRIFLVLGESGAGKTHLCKIFENSDAKGKAKTIFWASLADEALRAQLAEAISSGKDRNISSAVEELGSNDIIFVHDAELSSRSPAQSEVFRDLVYSCIAREQKSPFLIVTSQKTSNLVVESLFPKGHVAKLELNVIPLRELASEEAKERIREVELGECKWSMLSATLLDWLMNKGGISGQEWKALAEHQSDDIKVRYQLLRLTFARLDSGQKELVRYLIVWASIDPGYDFLRSEVVRDSEVRAMMTLGSHDLDHMFHPNNPGIRLAHRSILDLYNQPGVFDSSHPRDHYHKECLCDLPKPDETSSFRGSRIAVMRLRHRLRGDVYRNWDQLAEIDSAHLSAANTSLHEVGFALDDFLSVWPDAEALDSDGSTSPRTLRLGAGETTMARWFYPAAWTGTEMKSERVLWLTGLTMMGELCYQALDKWDLAMSIGRWVGTARPNSHNFVNFGSLADAVQTLREELEEAGPTTAHHLDLRLITVGLYAAMLYENAQKSDGLDVGTFRSTLSRNWSQDARVLFESYSINQGLDQVQRAYLDSLRSNEIVAATKANLAGTVRYKHSATFGLHVDVESLAELMSASASILMQDSADWYSRVTSIDFTKALTGEAFDGLRYRLIWSRLLFLSEGVRVATEYLEKKILYPSLTAPNEISNHLRSSQEFFYAWTQYLIYCVYLEQETAEWLRESFGNLPDLTTEDAWAQHQNDIALARYRFYVEEKGSIEYLRDLLSRKKEFFANNDSKAACCCEVGSVFLLHNDNIERVERLSKIESFDQFLQEELWYRLCVNVVLQDKSHVIQRWIPSLKASMSVPIMPPMLILRGIPICFSPRVDEAKL